MRELLILLAFSALWACAEDIEGCLDPRAVDYNIEADKEGECSYPEMRLEFSRIYRDSASTFSAGEVYLSSLGRPFILTEGRFYISDVLLKNQMGDTFRIEEDLQFEYELNGIKSSVRTDDIFLYRTDRLQFTAGTFKHPGDYMLSLGFGIAEELERAVREELDDNHPLNQSQMYDASGERVLDLNFSIIPDTSAMQDTLQIAANVPLYAASIAGTIGIPMGTDFVIPLTIDYYTLFFNIDFETDDPADIAEKIGMNFTAAIRLN